MPQLHRRYAARRGLKRQVMNRVPSVKAADTNAKRGSVSSRIAVAAQPIDENASAKVASRDEV